MAHDSQLYAQGIGFLDLDTTICFSHAIQINSDTLTVNSSDTIQWLNCHNGNIIAGAISNIYIPQSAGNYAALVTEGSCVDTTACVSYTGVSHFEVSDGQLSVYPNPATDKIFISTQQQIISITLTTVLGQKVFYTQQQLKEINTAALPRGIYFIQLQTHQNIITMKVVVE